MYGIVGDSRALKKKQPLIEQTMKREEKKMIDDIFADFMYLSGIPFNVTRNLILEVILIALTIK